MGALVTGLRWRSAGGRSAPVYRKVDTKDMQQWVIEPRAGGASLCGRSWGSRSTVQLPRCRWVCKVEEEEKDSLVRQEGQRGLW